MGEVRCPMCGKPNPDELDVCQYCEARLKPLLGPVEPADTPKAEEPNVGSVTDWLDSLRAQEGDELLDTPSDDFEVDENPEEVLPTLEESDEQQTEADWLQGLRSDRELDQEADSDVDATRLDWLAGDAIQASDVPDWLSGLGKDFQDEDDVQSDVETGTEQKDELIVTSSIEREDSEGEEQDFAATIPGQADGEVPEHATESTIFEDSLEEDKLAIEPADWKEGTLFPPEGEAEQQAELPQSNEDIPDWLVGFVESEPVSSAEPTEDIEPESGQTPDWLVELEDTAGLEVPDDVHKDEPDETQTELGASATRQLDLEAEPEYSTTLDDLQQAPPFAIDEEEVILDTGEVPEWLSGALAQDAGDEEASFEEDDASLTPAELPDWMESMRPVEAAAPAAPIPDRGDHSVESSGPLAGLRGVLPLEAGITQLKKPVAYAIKLQVSDNQRKHASLFEELISTEGVSAPVEPGVRISSQTILRVAIFLLLLLVVGWPIYTGSQSVGLPEPAREINQTSQLINAISVSEPVLLAVDYEPGFSGEMEAASAALVDHLMIRGAYLAVVSSTPTGPAQAERLIETINLKVGHTYQSPTQYSNLGYVPGGPAGLLSFAHTPRQVTPFGLNGEPGWEVAPLANIQTLADFASIIVITDNPDTARTWVEQVQPTLADTEMIMVVSAQAEPLVRPYYEASPQQVQGLVTGLAGGAAYERGMPRTSLARTYWDAFSYGLALAVLLIVIGSIINSVSGVMTSGKQAFRKKGK